MSATYLMIKMTSRKDAIISFLQNKANKLRAFCIGLNQSIKSQGIMRQNSVLLYKCAVSEYARMLSKEVGE